MSESVMAPGEKLRVLGIDPGTYVVGYGILDLGPGRPSMVVHGAIRLPSRPLAARLETIFREVRSLIDAHAPQALAIEQVFYGKNFQSVLKVGEARGVVVLAAQMAGLAIHEYAPAMIKKAATGNGNAEKAQVQRMMARLLALEEAPQPVDASDALAAAFCHAQRLWRSRMGPQARKPGRARAAIPGTARAPKSLPALLARSAVRRGRASRRASGKLDIEKLLRDGRARPLGAAAGRKTRAPAP